MVLSRFRVWLWRKKFLKALSDEYCLGCVSNDDMCLLTGEVYDAEDLAGIAACYFKLGTLARWSH